MQPKAANPYLKTKILTASPEELRLLLYEGAIRFCRQSRDAMEAQDFEQSYNGLMRAQKIVLELSTSLNHTIAPDLCDKLSALYTYIYRRLVDANLKRETAPIDEAVKLLDYEKQTWQLLMQKLSTGPNAPTAADRIAGAQKAQQTAISSLSLNG
ncbi:MAG: flagellar export chaperone FliS [Planctomycetota bacterium]|nr:flagellar export chaperone FliS [Planctomycetota bacterium]